MNKPKPKHYSWAFIVLLQIYGLIALVVGGFFLNVAVQTLNRNPVEITKIVAYGMILLVTIGWYAVYFHNLILTWWSWRKNLAKAAGVPTEPSEVWKERDLERAARRLRLAYASWPLIGIWRTLVPSDLLKDILYWLNDIRLKKIEEQAKKNAIKGNIYKALNNFLELLEFKEQNAKEYTPGEPEVLVDAALLKLIHKVRQRVWDSDADIAKEEVWKEFLLDGKMNASWNEERVSNELKRSEDNIVLLKNEHDFETQLYDALMEAKKSIFGFKEPIEYKRRVINFLIHRFCKPFEHVEEEDVICTA
jgi:hypothetical protein